MIQTTLSKRAPISSMPQTNIFQWNGSSKHPPCFYSTPIICFESVFELPNPNLFGRPALISLFCPSVEMPEFYLVYRAESGWDHLEGIVSAVTANIKFIPLPQSWVLDSALIVFFTARSKQPQCSKKPSEHNTTVQCLQSTGFGG